MAIGGAAGLGARVGETVSLVAETVESILVFNSGHFGREECPEEIVCHLLAATASVSKS